MSALAPTAHAAVRMAQRGILPKDAELIVLIGTEVDDGFLVRHKDFLEVERDLKALLRRFRGLVGKRLVVENDRIVTAYHSTEKYRRRLLRHTRHRNLYD